MGHTQTILISDWWMGGKFVSLSGMRQSWICTLLDHTSNLMVYYYYIIFYFVIIKHPIVQMWVSNNHVHIQGIWTFQASKSMWFLLIGGICCINLQTSSNMVLQYIFLWHDMLSWSTHVNEITWHELPNNELWRGALRAYNFPLQQHQGEEQQMTSCSIPLHF